MTDDLYAQRAKRTEEAGARPCEGCAAPAVTVDCEGVPLCRDCADGLEQAAALSPCTRCGHTPKGCGRCGRDDPFLGAWIDSEPYCHTFSETKPTCYESASRDAWQGADKWVTPFPSSPARRYTS